MSNKLPRPERQSRLHGAPSEPLATGAQYDLQKSNNIPTTEDATDSMSIPSLVRWTAVQDAALAAAAVVSPALFCMKAQPPYVGRGGLGLSGL